MPGVWVSSTFAMKVWPRPFRAPQKWMIVHKLSCLRILTVSFGFRSKRPHHLGMAANATFANINVTTQNFEWRIWFNSSNRRNVLFHQIHGNDFDHAANEHGDHSQGGKGERFGFQPTVPPWMFIRFYYNFREYGRLSFLFRNEFSGFRGFI